MNKLFLFLFGKEEKYNFQKCISIMLFYGILMAIDLSKISGLSVSTYLTAVLDR